MKLLTKRINQSGLTMQEFCKNHLKTDYRTFQYRMKTDHYYPAEVIYICLYLNDRCENIFGKTFEDLVLLTGPEEIVQAAKRLIGGNNQRLISLMDHKLITVDTAIEPMKRVVTGMEPTYTITEPVISDAGAAANIPVDSFPAPKQDPPKPADDFEFKFIDLDLKSPIDESRVKRVVEKP
jgi:hypothetical protein